MRATSRIGTRLAALSADYERHAGRPFEHFFCPILHRDEPAPLCRGHIINQAFRRSSRAWTVQREDVDNFFGAVFESDFVILQERGRHSLMDVFRDPTLARQLRPEVRIDGQAVDFYRPRAGVPSKHTEVVLQREQGRPVHLALKLSPSEALAAQYGSWEIGFERDLRLPALVSLLKAAHLTMFGMLGYSWALSLAGRFVGHDILGQFFNDNRDRARSDILTAAGSHFCRFVNLVRPIKSALVGLRGTITDHYLYMCTGTDGPWAFIVLVRSGTDFHGVLLPIFEDAERSARYLRFVHDPAAPIHARVAKFQGDHWEVSTREQTIHWPKPSWI